MESSKLKNMVVLKNLPSNIVDEAIIVLKKRKGTTLANAIGELKNIPMSLNELPWRNLLWLEDRKTINGRPNKKELMNLSII